MAWSTSVHSAININASIVIRIIQTCGARTPRSARNRRNITSALTAQFYYTARTDMASPTLSVLMRGKLVYASGHIHRTSHLFDAMLLISQLEILLLVRHIETYCAVIHLAYTSSLVPLFHRSCVGYRTCQDIPALRQFACEGSLSERSCSLVINASADVMIRLPN